jgi:4-amino-4-deoxychorismate lyase
MSNLVFFDGTRWLTPSTPLLPGTCRERLLSDGKISERRIRQEDLYLYQGVKLINAMRELDEEEFIPIGNIHF